MAFRTVYVVEVVEFQRESRVAGVFDTEQLAIAGAEALIADYEPYMEGVRPSRKVKNEWSGPVAADDPTEGNAVRITVTSRRVNELGHRSPG